MLWTDGRYHVQAAEELDHQWTLMKQGVPNVPTMMEWIKKVLIIIIIIIIIIIMFIRRLKLVVSLGTILHLFLKNSIRNGLKLVCVCLNCP